MIRKAFFLTDSQIQRLEAESQRTGLSVAELVRRAIDAYLDRLSSKEKGK